MCAQKPLACAHHIRYAMLLCYRTHFVNDVVVPSLSVSVFLHCLLRAVHFPQSTLNSWNANFTMRGTEELSAISKQKQKQKYISILCLVETKRRYGLRNLQSSHSCDESAFKHCSSSSLTNHKSCKAKDLVDQLADAKDFCSRPRT